jgi:hypothetical protein
MAAYDAFAAPEQTGALKVVLEGEPAAREPVVLEEPVGAVV